MEEKKAKQYVSDNPRLNAEWDWEKNAELGYDPNKLTCGSDRKVWWTCYKGHKWQAAIGSRSSGCKCPYCAGLLVIKGENDLQTVNPVVAKEWNYEKNDGLAPADVMYNSSKKVWWRCSNGHEWPATIASRNNRKRGCPYCAGQKAVVGINDLKTINPSLAREWNYKKTMDLLQKT